MTLLQIVRFVYKKNNNIIIIIKKSIRWKNIKKRAKIHYWRKSNDKNCVAKILLFETLLRFSTPAFECSFGIRIFVLRPFSTGTSKTFSAFSRKDYERSPSYVSANFPFHVHHLHSKHTTSSVLNVSSLVQGIGSRNLSVAE